ncbi:hypothetical protein HK100_009183 [Physocladia obscura]|uniref:Uncharacterized protein n=1 Tax=Physocladia obscura TaxID=109957 RepID=A0AAD5SM45_9FUNG|nr:hypothetical protein HK100_009183 [Physocladia obscura]
MFKSKKVEAAEDKLPDYPVPQVLYIPKPCFVERNKWITHLLTHPSSTTPYLEIAHDLQNQAWFKSRVFTVQPSSMDAASEADFLYAFGRKSEGILNSKEKQIILVGGRDEDTPTSLGIQPSLFLTDGVFLNPFRSENVRYCWVKKPRGIFPEKADVVLQKWEEHNSQMLKEFIAGFCFDFANGGRLFAMSKIVNGELTTVEAWSSLEELAFIAGTAFETVMTNASKLAKYDTAVGIAIAVLTGGAGYGGGGVAFSPFH